MTMRVTILSTVMGESGSLLTAGSTYTVGREFGEALVGGNRATDTDGVLTPPQTEMKPYFATDPLTGAVTGLVGPGGSDALSNLDAWKGVDCPCNDGAGLVKDQSGNGLDLTPGSAAAAGMWANAGYVTTTAGANGFVYLPVSRLSFDLQTDSFLLAMKVNIAAPGTNQSIVGCGTSASYGFYLSARTGTNGLVPVFYANGGNFVGTTYDTRMVVCDGTDHHVVVAYDAPSRSVFMYKDGALAYAFHNALPITGPSPTTYGLTIGANYNTVGATAFAGKFAGVKFGVFKGAGLPKNINQIARKLAKNPLDEMRLYEVKAAPKKRLTLGWLGQSNEFGACSDFYPTRTTSGGWPALDPMAVGNRPFDSAKTNFPTVGAASASSWHPKMSDLAGVRGVALTTMPTAIGTTCITQYWVGQICTWSASTTYALGAYALASGNVYKLTSSTNGTSTNIAATAGTVPTWPGSGTVVDGEATWTYVRAALGTDVLGIVNKDSTLFDPNAKLAIVKQCLDNYPVGDRAVAISIGQGDKTVGATAALYQAALESATNWALAQGYKVFIGLTMSGSTAGYDAWLTGTAQPARTAALNTFRLNGSVYAGADLRAALGALAVTTADIGVVADQLHGNHWAIDSAAVAWDSALSAAGY